MKTSLGLDISSSCTGVCLLVGDEIETISAIELSKCKTLWDKADVVKDYLTKIQSKHPKLDHLSVEEPLLGFQKGMSSATTITTLMKFNGIVSYISRGIFGIDPTYISSAHARKLCGIKMQRTAVAGMSGKEQVFKHMSENDLKGVEWPKKKNGKEVDWSRDATDAYVIAKAALLMNK